MTGYEEGTKIEWDWGNGTASGTIVERYTQKRTLKIDGNSVTRDASEDCPSYKIEQADGQEVFKSHSEVRKR
ncbi:DUF2945 domain-containing protein [Erythrobacter sp. YT30]|uniref:DUF2945 domain-containing protein n=1 Tax=Erythrobacter sp. YT30 TaxID=1735012 RepID=UPI00076DC16D|nr:DUF2945 domain-containing protein [Erythrobacter sp. YT30]KWV92721.1 hypothetical protein AUC45_00675 [Erythrobacter sp. YT30]